MADQLKILISADLKKAKTDLEVFKKQVNGTEFKIGSKSQVGGVRSEIDKTTKSVGALSGGLLDNISKFSKWFIIGNLVSKVSGAMSELAENVTSTDASLTTMAFTIDKTYEELSDVADATIQFAQELGSTGKMALEATKIFTNMNASIEEILQSSKDSVILSNLANLDISTSSDSLQALKNQFRLTDEEASTLVDTLTFVSSNLSVDFSRGIKEISSGIANSGQTARDAGLSVEQYTALLGRSVELSRRSGNSLSAGIRTITNRIRRVSELGAEDLSKLDAAYKDIGINIRKNETEFKDFATILTELSAKTKDLSKENKETTLSLIGFLSAGSRQADTFKTLVEVWDSANELAKESTKNIGFATEKNELFIKSIAGQKNILTATYEEFSRGILSPDFFKGFYSGATEFVNSLINIQESVGLVNSALLLLLPTLISLKGALVVDKIASFAGALLSLNPIVLGITLAVGTYVALASSYNAAQKEMTENLNESTKALEKNNNEFLKNQDIIDRFDELANKTNKTAEETREFNEIQDTLNAIMPEVKDKIDAQNISLQEQINLYQQLNKEARDKALEQAQDNIDKFGDKLETNTVIIAKNQQRVKALKKELVDYRDEVKNLDKSNVNYGERQKFLSGLIDNLKDSIKDLDEQSKELEGQNNNLRKSEELLAIAQSESILAIDGKIVAYRAETTELKSLSGKNKEELEKILTNEKQHTTKILGEISKRINARIAELSPTEGTPGADYIQFAQGMSDPIIKGLLKRKNQIDEISRQTVESISNPETTGSFIGSGSGDDKEIKYLSSQEQALADINRELALLQNRNKAGLETDDKVIDKLKKKQDALNKLAGSLRGKLGKKGFEEGSEAANKLQDEISSLSSEYFSAEDAIKAFAETAKKESEDIAKEIEESNKEIAESYDEVFNKLADANQKRYEEETSSRKKNLEQQITDTESQLDDLKNAYDSFNEQLEKDDINEELSKLASERLMQEVIGNLESKQRIVEIDEEAKKLTKQLDEKERREKYENEKQTLEDKKDSLKQEIKEEEDYLKERLSNLEHFHDAQETLQNKSMENIIDILATFNEQFAKDGKTKGEEWAKEFQAKVKKAMELAGNVQVPQQPTAPTGGSGSGSGSGGGSGATSSGTVRVRNKNSGEISTISRGVWEGSSSVRRRYEQLNTGGKTQSDGMAMLHKDEVVLNPAQISKTVSDLGLQNMSASRNASTLFNVANGRTPQISNNSNSSSNSSSAVINIDMTGMNVASKSVAESYSKSLARTIGTELQSIGLKIQ